MTARLAAVLVGFLLAACSPEDEVLPVETSPTNEPKLAVTPEWFCPGNGAPPECSNADAFHLAGGWMAVCEWECARYNNLTGPMTATLWTDESRQVEDLAGCVGVITINEAADCE